MDHGGVELGTDRTELLHWITLFQEATAALRGWSPQLHLWLMCFYFPHLHLFPKLLFFCFQSSAEQSTRISHSTDIFNPAPCLLPTAMALGSAAISSLISVAFKWYAWKNDMHVKGLNVHQILVLSPPSLPYFFFLEEEWFQFRGNTLTKLPKTMHLPFKVDRKAKPRVSRGKWHSEFIHFTASFIDQDSRKRSDELGARKEGTGFILAVLSLATRGLQSRVRWNWWCPLGHWSGCRRQSCLRPSKSEGRKKSNSFFFEFEVFFPLENQQLKAAGPSVGPWWTTSVLPLSPELGHWENLIKHVRTEQNHLIGCQKP